MREAERLSIVQATSVRPATPLTLQLAIHALAREALTAFLYDLVVKFHWTLVQK